MAEHGSENGRREIIYVQAPDYGMKAEDEIDLLDLWETLWRGKWFILGVSMACVLGAALVSMYFMSPKYRAEALITPTKESKNVIRNYLRANTFHKELIKEYDLLPRMYPERWDAQAQSWKGSDGQGKPSVQRAVASEGRFPLEIEADGSNLAISWTCSEPAFCKSMLDNVLAELKSYLRNEYVSSAQESIDVLKSELASLLEVAKQSKNVELGVLVSLAGLQSKIAELRTENILSRKFSIVDEPLTPQAPYEPNTKLIVGLAFVLGLFVSIFLVFFRQFLRNARERLAARHT